MKLVFITQHVDPSHPALAATVPQLAELAQRVDEVVVIADGVAPGALPPNARVKTFRSDVKLVRGARFAAALAPELRGRKDVAVLAHMCPIYAVLAAPLARPLGIPVLLWYAHWNETPTLRLAERACTAIVTTDRRTFPIRSPKVVPVGQAIDVERFRCRTRRAGDLVEAVALGRYSPAKGYEQMLEAVAKVDNIRLRIYGPTLTDEERAHRRELERLAGPRVELHDAVPRERIPLVLEEADVLVNNMRGGTSDKVVYEAGASCVPVVASNPVFDDLLADEWRFPREDGAALAERLRAFAALAHDDRVALGAALRERVLERHSVDSWADGILAAARR